MAGKIFEVGNATSIAGIYVNGIKNAMEEA